MGDGEEVRVEEEVEDVAVRIRWCDPTDLFINIHTTTKIWLIKFNVREHILRGNSPRLRGHPLHTLEQSWDLYLTDH